MNKIRMKLAVVLAGTLTAATALMGPTSGASAAPVVADATASCSDLTDPIYSRVQPDNDANLLTPSLQEALNAVLNLGFTDDEGVAFDASVNDGPGLIPVHRMKKLTGPDFMYSASPGEWQSAVARHGYVDQGTSFYVATDPQDCLVPVHRYRKDGIHRLASTQADEDALAADGWIHEGVVFYAAPGTAGTDPTPTPTPTPTAEPTDDPGDTEFSFAVYPDTQQEVLSTRDTRFINRAQWLVKNEDSLDLRWMLSTGDNVNWDTDDHSQYEIASKAMVPLEDAHIPYTLAIGNHDTEATGVGGAARDSKRTRILQRDTTTFNSYFNATRYGGVAGAYEAGKVDNIYTLHNAGGVKWMVLTLELWPRPGVVDWAKQVVASHPDYNVIIATHDYLDPNGGLEQSSEYGDTSPQQLYDELVSQYANIRMVLSGHVGIAASRVDTGVHGNKIYSFMTTIHSNTTNPIRLFTIDTANDTIKTWIYAPFTDATMTEYSQTVTGVDWVQ